MKKENIYKDMNKNENLDFLKSISGNKEFEVPQGYFNDLKQEIMDKKSSDSIFIQAKNRFRILKTITAVAAVFTIGVFVYKSNQTVEKCVTFACLFEEADLSDHELEYLEEDAKLSLFDDEEEDLF